MRFTYALPVLALLAFATPALAEEYVIMKVNGQDVSSADAQRFWEGLFPQGQAPAFEGVKPDVRDKVLRGVMAEKLLMGEAQKAGTDKNEAVVKQIEDVKRKIVVRAFLESKTSDISEADIKKEYDGLVASLKDEKEVHARHILLNSEAEAKDAKKKIDEGKSFEDVAKSVSKDAGSAKNGGDLGYFTKDKMVPEFANAAFNMKKGDISAPVKSSFGWHIIKVEDVRPVKAPAYAEVKDELKSRLQDKKLNDYVSGLVKSADVKVFDTKGKAVSFDKNMPAPNAKVEKAEPVKAEKEKPVDKPAEKKTDVKPDAVKSDKKADKVEKVDKVEKTEKPAPKAEQMDTVQ